MKKERKSNFELLRIVAILLIISYHFCIHGNNGTIFSSAITGNQMISVLFGTWGLVGVDVFVLISAYFLIDSQKFKISGVLLIIINTIFYSVILALIFFCTNTVPFNIKDLIKSFISPFTDQYWFVSCYIMMFLIYPFLNIFIKAASYKVLSCIVVILTILTPIYGTIGFGAPVNGFSMFIYLYLFMGFLKYKENNFFHRNAKKGLIVIVLSETIIYILLLGINTFIKSDVLYLILGRMFIDKFSVTSVFISIFLFYIFKDLRIKNYRIINVCAESVLGIYLLHENGLMRTVLWDKWLHINVWYNRPVYILYLAFVVIALFFICLLIDFVRINTLQKYIVVPLIERSKLVKKIDEIYLGIMYSNESSGHVMELSKGLMKNTKSLEKLEH